MSNTSFQVQSYVPMSVTLDASATTFTTDDIWIAIYGELILNQGSGTTPASGTTYYLDPTQLNKSNQPIPQSIANLSAPSSSTPDQVLLPSFTLTQWGNNLSMPAPVYTPASPNGLTQFSGRCLISVGLPVQSQVNSAGAVSAPSASDPFDPSTGTFCDFLEFTIQSNSDGTSNFDMDTSQVDSFGLPMQLQFFQDAAGTQPFNYTFTGTATAASNTITATDTLPAGVQIGALVTGPGIPASASIVAIDSKGSTVTLSQPATAASGVGATFTAVLAGPVGVLASRNDLYGSGNLSFSTFIAGFPSTNLQAPLFAACTGPWPMRLITPKDLSEMYNGPTYTDSFNSFFNATIDTFFLKYYKGTIGTKTGGAETFSLVSEASGSSVTYSGTVVLVDSNYVLQLTNPGKTETYNIYYPFFSGITIQGYTPLFTPGTAPSWLPKPLESASQMVWGCDGVFADSAMRPAGSFQTVVLGDLEDSISAAFNRGIILNDPSTWGNTSTWFDASIATNAGVYNYWVQYWHQQGLMANNLAYAFPYDDKFGASTNMQQSSVGLVGITLGGWGSQLLPTITIAQPTGTVNQSGNVTLTATVSGTGATPTGTVTFYIDGYPVSTQLTTGDNPYVVPGTVPSANYYPPNVFPIALANGCATQNGVCPPLSGGSATHTYTVVAIYSGDTNYLPYVGSMQLQLVSTVPPNSFNLPSFGDLVLGGSFDTGSTISLQDSGTINGSVEISLWQPIGTTSLIQVGSTVTVNNVTANPVPIAGTAIPSLSFTGTTTSGSPILTAVSSCNGLSPNQVLTGPGIPENTTVASFAPASGNASTITMSNNATATNANATISSNGINSTYQLQAVYTPSGGQPQAALPSTNFTPVAG